METITIETLPNEKKFIEPQKMESCSLIQSQNVNYNGEKKITLSSLFSDSPINQKYNFLNQKTPIQMNPFMNKDEEENYSLEYSILNLSNKRFFNIKQLNSLAEYRENLLILDLGNNDIMKFPIEIMNYLQLKKINLDYNMIKLIPSEFCEKMQKIEKISLRYNLLEQIPSNIFNLKCLKSLKVNNNLINSIPSSIGYNINLEKINISSNLFTYIPTSISLLKSLKKFTLDWFKYTTPPLNKHYINIPNFLEILSKFHKDFSSHIFLIDFIKEFSLSESDIYLKKYTKNGTILHEAVYEKELGVLQVMGKKYEELIDLLDCEGNSALIIGFFHYLNLKILFFQAFLLYF